MSSSQRELLYAVLVVAASLVITAVILEAGLRLLGYRGAPESIIGNMMIVDDPILNWRFIPNSRFQQGRIVNHYNSAGFRGEDHPIEKAKGITRIVVIGDSVTEGYGVEWQEAFGPAVQQRLGPRYEVISLGMGGLNTPQEVHILEKVGLQYAPDYVVVNFVLNDCDFFSQVRADDKRAAEIDSKIGLLGIDINPDLKRTLKSSALIYLVYTRVSDLWGRLKGEERHDYYKALWASERNRARITIAFERLRWLSQSHGFKVIVLLWPLLTDFGSYEFSYVHEWVMERATTNDFASIDLLPVYATQPFRRLQITSEDHVHPNAFGHRLAAEQFVNWIASTPSNGGRMSSTR